MDYENVKIGTKVRCQSSDVPYPLIQGKIYTIKINNYWTYDVGGIKIRGDRSFELEELKGRYSVFNFNSLSEYIIQGNISWGKDNNTPTVTLPYSN